MPFSTMPTIAANYGITSWLEKTMLRQSIKTMKDPGALMQAYLGSLAWSLLVLVGLMSAILTLLYWRLGRYYVEHFIFLTFEHTGAFLLLTLAFWINYFLPFGWFWGIIILWLFISPILAIHRFYGQKLWISLLKSLVFWITYLASFFCLFLLGIILVFIVF